MAGSNGADSLRDAVCEALKVGGPGLLDDPRNLYAMLTDLLAGTADAEMRVLRGVLSDECDNILLSGVARLSSFSSVADVEAEERRIKARLVGVHQRLESVSASCAKGLAEGVAKYLGVDLSAKRQPSSVPQPKSEPEPEPMPQPQPAVIPVRVCTVKVTKSLMESGGKDYFYLTKCSVDAKGDVEIGSYAGSERHDYVVPAHSRVGDTVLLSGQGYHAPDGRRGDLVVRLELEKEPASQARQQSAPKPQPKPEPQPAAIPKRICYAYVSKSLMESGGRDYLTLSARRVDARGKVEGAAPGANTERHDFVVPAHSKEGDTVLLAGQGYHAPDGRRGDLVVRLKLEKEPTPQPKAQSQPQAKTKTTTAQGSGVKSAAKQQTPSGPGSKKPTETSGMRPVLTAIILFFAWYLLVMQLDGDGTLAELEGQGIPRLVTLAATLLATHLLGYLIGGAEAAGCLFTSFAVIFGLTASVAGSLWAANALGLPDGLGIVVGMFVIPGIALYFFGKSSDKGTS